MPRPRNLLQQGQNEEMIRGPLGLWPFPLINVLYQFRINVMQQKIPRKKNEEKRKRPEVSTYNVTRDEKGRIESIEIMENLTGKKNE